MTKFSYNGLLYRVLSYHGKWVIAALDGVRDDMPTVIEMSHIKVWYHPKLVYGKSVFDERPF